MAGVANAQPHPEWRLLVDRYSDAPYGMIIAHADIAAATGLSYKSRRYYGQVNAWIRRMEREHHRAVRAVPGTGYEVVKPDDYTGFSRSRFLGGRRRIRRAALTAEIAPVEEMSPQQATKHANMLAYLAPLRSLVNKVEVKTRPKMLTARPDFPKLSE